MKITQTLVLVFFLASFLGTAQITKGNFLVGGNGNFSYTKFKQKPNPNTGSIVFNNINGEILGILLEPNIGYFIKDKFAVGLKIGFENNFNSQSSFQINQTQFSLGPFLRYYFLNTDKPFNLFVEPSYYTYTYKPLGNANGFGLKVGHVYFLNSSVGVESSLNYQYRDIDQSTANTLFVAFGFQLYLEKKN
jgi:hypothetical protein